MVRFKIRIGSIPLVAVLFLMLCFGLSATLPELHAQPSTNVGLDRPVEGYLSPPTAGRFNMDEVVDVVQNVEFSVERRFYDAAFQLTLATPTPAAEIRYTLDGSTPTSTTGIVYSGPLIIDGTTVIRAAAFKSNYLDSSVGTKTYIFVSDVMTQSPNGEAPGPGWPTRSVNGQTIDYGMDPDIVNDPRWAGLIEDALLDIPTISLVTDLANLFGPSTGI